MLVSKGNNNKWTYNHTDHLMKNLETIIGFITYIVVLVDLDSYELHMRDEKVFIDFIGEC